MSDDIQRGIERGIGRAIEGILRGTGREVEEHVREGIETNEERRRREAKERQEAQRQAQRERRDEERARAREEKNERSRQRDEERARQKEETAEKKEAENQHDDRVDAIDEKYDRLEDGFDQERRDLRTTYNENRSALRNELRELRSEDSTLSRAISTKEREISGLKRNLTRGRDLTEEQKEEIRDQIADIEADVLELQDERLILGDAIDDLREQQRQLPKDYRSDLEEIGEREDRMEMDRAREMDALQRRYDQELQAIEARFDGRPMITQPAQNAPQGVAPRTPTGQTVPATETSTPTKMGPPLPPEQDGRGLPPVRQADAGDGLTGNHMAADAPPSQDQFTLAASADYTLTDLAPTLNGSALERSAAERGIDPATVVAAVDIATDTPVIDDDRPTVTSQGLTV